MKESVAQELKCDEKLIKKVRESAGQRDMGTPADYVSVGIQCIHGGVTLLALVPSRYSALVIGEHFALMMVHLFCRQFSKGIIPAYSGMYSTADYKLFIK